MTTTANIEKPQEYGDAIQVWKWDLAHGSKRDLESSSSSGDENKGSSFKYARIDFEDLTDLIKESSLIKCNLTPSCSAHIAFGSIQEYERHYHSVHINVCNSCKNILPSPHILDLHISERHDSFFAARLNRGHNVLLCFVEGCKADFKLEVDRVSHLRIVHGFPKKFKFKNAIDGDLPFNSSNKNRKKSKSKPKINKEVDDIMVDGITTAMNQLPLNLSFGHSKTKAFSRI